MTAAVSIAQQGSNNTTFRNRIINGAMTIDQRNAGASVTNIADNVYTLDRWKYYADQASKFTVQQNAGSVTPPAGFKNYLGVTSLSAYTVGASEIFMLRQVVEAYNMADLAWGTSDAKTVTLSFWVRSSLTGTFGGSLSSNGQTYTYPFTYTISSANTWEQKSITITGATSGTWLSTNGAGIILAFGLGIGSTYNGTAGAWTSTASIYGATGATSVVGTNGATFYITGVQLEAGSAASPFENRLYGTELSLCQRYYEVAYNGTGSDSWYSSASGGGGQRYWWNFKVEKRAQPSTALGTGSSWYGATPTAYPSLSACQFYTSSTAFGPTGANGTVSVAASAEL